MRQSQKEKRKAELLTILAVKQEREKLAALRLAGASCQSCKHSVHTPAGPRDEWICKLDSWEGYAVVLLDHLCSRHKASLMPFEEER